MKNFKVLALSLLVQASLTIGFVKAQLSPGLNIQSATFLCGVDPNVQYLLRDSVTAPNGLPSSLAELGPNYGCLSTTGSVPQTLRPHWFRFEAGSTGYLELRLIPVLNNNLDFVVFGPFSSPNPTANDPGFQSPMACSNSTTLIDTIKANFVSNHIGQYFFIMVSNPEGRLNSTFRFEPTALSTLSFGSKLRFLGGNTRFLRVCDAPISLLTVPNAASVNGLVYSGPGVNPSTGVFTPSVAGVGTHVVLVTGRPFSCAISRTDTCVIQVTANPSSVDVVSSGNLTPGSGPVSVSAVVNPAGLYSYTWTVPSGVAVPPVNQASLNTTVHGWYKVVATPDPVTLPACSPSTDSVYVYTGPTVSRNGNDTICWNTNPSITGTQITNLPTGVSVTGYQWQYRMGAAGSWNDLLGQTVWSALNRVNVSGLLDIRLRVNLSNSVVVSSNSVSIQVLPPLQRSVMSVVSPGTSTICYNGSISLAITPSLGSTNVIAYQWQRKPLVGGDWTEIFPRNTNLTRTISSLTSSTMFRVVSSDTSVYTCGSVISDTMTVFVQDSITSGSIALSNPGDTLLCVGNTATLINLSSATGGYTGSTFVYVWEESTDGTTWNVVSTTLNPSLPLNRIFTTTGRKFYRRGVTSTLNNVTCPTGGAVYTPPISITWIYDYPHLSALSQYTFTGPFAHPIWETSVSTGASYSIKSSTSTSFVDSLRLPSGATASSGSGEYRLLAGNIPSDGIILFDLVPGAPDCDTCNTVVAPMVTNLTRSLIVGAGSVPLSNTSSSYAIKVFQGQTFFFRKSYSRPSSSQSTWVVDRINNFRFMPNKVGTSDSICANDSITISKAFVGVDNSPATWQWTKVNGAGTVSGVLSGSGALAGPVTYRAVAADAGTTVRLRLVATRSTSECAGRSDTIHADIKVRAVFVRANVVASQHRNRCYLTSAGTLNATPASGGSGPYQYIWQYRQVGSSTWTDLPGSNSLSYTDSRNLSATTDYRILTTDLGVPSCANRLVGGDSIRVTVLPSMSAPVYAPNVANYLNRCPNDTISLLVSGAIGAHNNFRYTWQYVNVADVPAGATPTDPNMNSWPWINILGKINLTAPAGLRFTTPALPSGSNRYYRVVATDVIPAFPDSGCGSVWSRAMQVQILDTVKPIVRAKPILRLFAGPNGQADFNCAFTDTLNNQSSDNCLGIVSNFVLRKVGTGMGKLDPPGPSCPPPPGATTEGNSFLSAIPVPSLPAQFRVNNAPGSGFTSTYLGPNAQPSADIFYRFNSGTFDSIAISTCGGALFNSYLHLLDGCGNYVTSNNNNGPLCASVEASLVVKVSPNTDYVVVFEGDGNSSINGDTLSVSGRSYCPSFSCRLTSDTVAVLFGTDASGNIDSDTLRVVVVDTVRPIARSTNIIVYLDSNGSVTPSAALANNGSTDNCSFTLSYGLVPASFNCARLGVNTATLRATDASGNVGTTSVQVDVRDTIRPRALPKQLVNVYLNQAGTACLDRGIDSLSWDNCKVDSSYATIPGRSTICFSCINVDSSYLANFFVLDSARNTSNPAPFVATVKDTLAPRVTRFPDSIIYFKTAEDCQELFSWDSQLMYEDNCSGPVTISNVTINTLPAVSPILLTKGLHVLRFRLTDIRGNFKDYTHNVELVDTIRPVLTACPSNIVAYTGPNCTANVTWTPPTASDNCTAFTLTSNFNSGSTFSPGVTTIVYTVTDAVGLSSTCSFTVTVSDTLAPQATALNPTVYLAANGQVVVPIVSIVNAVDPCGQAVTYSVNNNPATSRTYTCDSLGSRVVIVRVCDNNNNCRLVSSIVSVLDTTKPVVNSKQNIVIYLSGGSSSSAGLNVSQVDSNSTDNCGIASRTLSQTLFNCNNVGVPNQIEFTVTDPSGNSRSRFVSVLVLDTVKPNGTALNPTVFLNSQGFVTVPVQDMVAVSDNCSGTLTFDSTSFTFNCSQLPSNSASVILTRNVVVRDANNNSRTIPATVVLRDNIAPVLTPVPTTLYLATNGQASVNLSSLVNISDNCCQGNITSVPVATGNVLTFNCASAALNNGVTNVQLQVSDCHGNTSTVTVPVTVLDRRPPTVSTLSPTVYLDANGSASLSATALVNATDACGGLVYSPPSVSFNCFQCNQTVSVTVNVRDANGNDTSVVVPVLVRDTIRPVSTSVPSNITVCRTASQVVYVQPNGTDNCGTVSVNQVAGLPSGSNFPVGVTTNTFNLLDVCGNVTQVSFTVTVRSGVSITWIPSNRANCTTDSSFDLTGGRTGYAFSGSGVIGNRFYPRLASPGLVPVSWTYVDVNGCDTTATLFIDLISAPVNPTIDRISLTLLRTTLSWDRYQWYRGDYPIPGATNREFNVSEWGNYSCEVMSPGGCFRLSNVITLGVGVSVDGPDNSKLMIYPNPTKGILNLAFSSLEFGTLSASISDMTGREVYRTDISDPISQLNLQALAQGEYILTLTSRTGSARHRIQVKY